MADDPSCVVDEIDDAQHSVYISNSGSAFSQIAAEHFHISNGKATEIVIEDESVLEDSLHSPSTSADPPTSPIVRENGFKYQWDESVLASVLPVRCRSTNGKLYKARFGSG